MNWAKRLKRHLSGELQSVLRCIIDSNIDYVKASIIPSY